MSEKPSKPSLFELGRVVVTPGALELSRERNIDFLSYLRRHQAGDWGDVSEFDKQANDEDLRIGERLLSAYRITAHVRFWIITERDRSVTTILLPSEY